MQNKNSLLSVLLTLRAGLSVASLEYYKAMRIIDIAQEVNNELFINSKQDNGSNAKYNYAKICAIQNESAAKNHALFHINSGLTLLDVMESTFNNVLDYEEWKNLDLIIHCVINDSATSFDQALSTIKSEVTHSNSKNKLSQALAEVDKFINYNLNDVREGFADYCEILSKKLAVQAHIIMDQTESQDTCENAITKTEARKNYIAELTSTINMISSLKEKSNISSLEIYDEVVNLRRNMVFKTVKKQTF